jgi:uncharacterized protein (DUF4415 family)
MKVGLSRHGARNRTNGGRTGKPSKAEQGGRGTDWKKLRRAGVASIRKGIESDAEARATNAEFWKDAKVIWPRSKTLVTMRLDADLLEWFRRERGYQTRINEILRTYMKAHAPVAPQSTPSKM